ncbi:MAG: hypothetical protein HFH68_16255 [Lachnospiraceae bacterium]|nr:hypothetical protein [Lachnospiraceae bacterium]
MFWVVCYNKENKAVLSLGIGSNYGKEQECMVNGVNYVTSTRHEEKL